MKNIYLKYFYLSLTIFSLFLASCKDEEDLGKAPRLFRPLLTVTTADNWIKAEWNIYEGAKSFNLQLSTDSFKTIYRDTTVTVNSCSFTNLEWDMVYQIRIKSMGDDGIESRYYQAPNVNIVYPTLLQNLATSDIIDVAARIRWTNSLVTPFDTIKIFDAGNDTLVKKVALNATNISNQMVEVSGLLPSYNYKVVIYSNGNYCGYKKFKTKEAQIFAIPVDLRSIDDATASTMITTAWLQSLADSSTVILKADMVYKITTSTYFEKSVTFVTGTSFGGGPAVFSMSSAFNITAGANFGKVEFKGVKIIGSNPAAGFAGNFGGYYAFNINTASTVQNLTLDGCTIKYLRGVFRTQTSGSYIGTYTVNNCIIDSIAGYGIGNLDNAGATVLNFVVTNSTISNAMYFLRSTRNPTTLTKTITVENCTFYRAPQSANYILDIAGTTTITDGVSVKNCIFGPGLPNTATPTQTTLNGYRAANIPILNTANNFKTSDLTWAGETAITDVSDYTGTTNDLYTSPMNGDFKIKDGNFVGRLTSGDPRWRPEF